MAGGLSSLIILIVCLYHVRGWLSFVELAGWQQAGEACFSRLVRDDHMRFLYRDDHHIETMADSRLSKLPSSWEKAMT